MESKLEQVQSTLVTLNDIVERDFFFNIPIYQRLYVWGKNQIETLLSDIWEACKEEKEVFYLGGTLVIERKAIDQHSPHQAGRYFDLIDGQQRFTTLWLISLAWQEWLSDYRYQETTEGLRHRINFAIRPQVKRFFDATIAGHTTSLPEARQLEDALAIIENFVNHKDQDNDPLDIPRLTRFIFEKVKLVFTQVPENTDLNKLFEVINNRGMQLQHHEILKARLLGKLSNTQQRECYGQLWDACSFMGDHVEKNLKLATDIKLIDYFENDASKSDSEALASAPKVLQALNGLLNAEEDTELSLSAILESSEIEASDRKQGDEDDYESGYDSDKVRSIITFPMLLQHVLRIWLVTEDRPDVAKILDKDLIAIFERSWLNDGASEQDVKTFIELLWEVRYLFDKYVIKWVEDEDEEVHSIRRLRKNKNTSSRNASYSLSRESTDSNGGFALLQSMLYHSQQMTTQYWLTPLLKYLLDHPGGEPYLYLKYLDNQLFCTGRSSALIERTRKPLEDSFALKRKRRFEELDETLGVGFPHYWFYKLEYILWTQLKDEKNDNWRSFRMTARNSVEHISPQTPEQRDTSTVSDKVLDSFGNLALVSRSINSEYSNLPFNEKRQRFLNKNRSGVDSLKMALIYEHTQWNDDLARQHQDDMIDRFVSYYRSVRKEVRKLRGESE